MGDWLCLSFCAAVVVLRGVRGLTSRLGGSSLTELAFGMLERSVNTKFTSFNDIYDSKIYLPMQEDNQ